jgi:hypothetical protein
MVRLYEEDIRGGNFVEVETGKNTKTKIHFSRIEHINHRMSDDGKEKYLFRSNHNSTSQSAEFWVEQGILFTVDQDMMNVTIDLSDAAAKRLQENIEKNFNLR